jgi:septal ring factor EnvC (AmiA/AmiB activator)
MLLRWIVCIGFLAALPASIAHAQSPSAGKTDELRQLRQSIEQTRARSKQLTTQEGLARRSLKTSQRQRLQLRREIVRLESELRVLQDSITTLQQVVDQTKSSIRSSEQRWRAVTHAVHASRLRRQGRPQTSRLTALAYQRTTGAVREFRDRMTMIADSLQTQAQQVGALAAEREQRLADNQSQRVMVDRSIRTGEKDLQKMARSKAELVEELRKKQASARRIAALIQGQVRKDEERRRSQARNGSKTRPRGGTSAQEPPTADAGPLPERGIFSRRSLPWPTSSRSIAQGYGMYRNPQTGTTLENPGIDIRSKAGSGVESVASGRVSTVTWLPGYGSLVIVDHLNGFRTVYANLTGVNVSGGSTVLAGTRLGSSSTNADGEVMHFEIWSGSRRLNPLSYLR